MLSTRIDREPTPGYQARRPPGRSLIGRATVAAAMLALAACSSSNTADGPSNPSETTPATVPATGPAAGPSTTTTVVRDGALAPGDHSVGAFVVPLSFTIIDDGWTRLLGQRRVLLLERDQVRVALSAAQLVADTPQGVVDKVCPGDIQLGDSIDAELLGGQATRAVGHVVTDCTIVLDTKGDAGGGRWVLDAGSDITIITTQVDGELIAAIASVPASPTDTAEIDRLLASFRSS